MKKIILTAIAIFLVTQNSFSQSAGGAQGGKIIFLQKSLEGLAVEAEELEVKQALILRYANQTNINIVVEFPEIITLASSPIYSYVAYKHYYAKIHNVRLQALRVEEENIRISNNNRPSTSYRDTLAERMNPEYIKYAARQKMYVAGTAATLVTEVIVRGASAYYNSKIGAFRDAVIKMDPYELQSTFVEISDRLEEVKSKMNEVKNAIDSIEKGR